RFYTTKLLQKCCPFLKRKSDNKKKLFLWFFRTSELVALVAVSSTLFLFLHTRDLSSKLKQMEVRLQPDDALTANQVSGESASSAVSAIIRNLKESGEVRMGSQVLFVPSPFVSSIPLTTPSFPSTCLPPSYTSRLKLHEASS
ncbi:uncharacterized protein LOC127752082, partial [Frankliniella occidentalis]|uniref:Uncharacterized protein LOC127752082 n=1 Tax=Frankliniella occidentalis TaxID=133901 RepID=A0A9C6XVG9_FRAOC